MKIRLVVALLIAVACREGTVGPLQERMREPIPPPPGGIPPSPSAVAGLITADSGFEVANLLVEVHAVRDMRNSSDPCTDANEPGRVISSGFVWIDGTYRLGLTWEASCLQLFGRRDGQPVRLGERGIGVYFGDEVQLNGRVPAGPGTWGRR